MARGTPNSFFVFGTRSSKYAMLLHICVCLQEQNGSNVMAASSQDQAQPYPSLSEQASAFLGGVLNSLPALLPFTAPSTNSYERYG